MCDCFSVCTKISNLKGFVKRRKINFPLFNKYFYFYFKHIGENICRKVNLFPIYKIHIPDPSWCNVGCTIKEY